MIHRGIDLTAAGAVFLDLLWPDVLFFAYRGCRPEQLFKFFVCPDFERVSYQDCHMYVGNPFPGFISLIRNSRYASFFS